MLVEISNILSLDKFLSKTFPSFEMRFREDAFSSVSPNFITINDVSRNFNINESVHIQRFKLNISYTSKITQRRVELEFNDTPVVEYFGKYQFDVEQVRRIIIQTELQQYQNIYN